MTLQKFNIQITLFAQEFILRPLLETIIPLIVFLLGVAFHTHIDLLDIIILVISFDIAADLRAFGKKLYTTITGVC